MGISGLVGLLGEGVELVNVDGTVRHGDDEFGRGSGEGEGFGGEWPGCDRSCRWRVASQDAETRRLWGAEYRTLRTPAAWVESTVWAPVSRSRRRTSQSMAALKASLSLRPKQTSRTGAGCSNFWMSLPPGSARVS